MAQYVYLLIYGLAGQTESGLTQIADLEVESQQLQSLNARLEEDLLAAERTGKRQSRAGNGHDDSEVMSGATGEPFLRLLNMLGIAHTQKLCISGYFHTGHDGCNVISRTLHKCVCN